MRRWSCASGMRGTKSVWATAHAVLARFQSYGNPIDEGAASANGAVHHGRGRLTGPVAGQHLRR
jgi:hypothetical protein